MTVNRRDFIKMGGMAAAGMHLFGGRVWAQTGSLVAVATIDRKALADAALTSARAAGAQYADVRIGRYRNQFINTREDKVQGITDTESFGFGVRVLVDGTWGFSASDTLTKEEAAKVAAMACAIAKANARIQTEKVQLAPVGSYQDTWQTPIKKHPWDVPIAEKAELLLAANAAALTAGASFASSNLFFVNEEKYFASTEGSYIDQNIVRTYPTLSVTAIDQASGLFYERAGLTAPVGMGYEYVTEFDLVREAKEAAQDALAKKTAKSVEPGKKDLVLAPSHLWLTIHESVGHPTELDRVLGYEANYAGTSFATLAWKAQMKPYGSKMVNIKADKVQPGSLGAVGYDDEGVKTKTWDILKDGMLVDYQAIRDQAHILGHDESNGCCYADNWSSVQFQRMANISLQPNPQPMTKDDLIKDVEDGIYIVGDGSFSIDQQRYNFQFGGQMFYEIKHGKITQPLVDVAYQANTLSFWGAMDGVADHRDYQLFGSFFDGKGQPGQSSAVSHGSSTARFRGINVINTKRNI